MLDTLATAYWANGFVEEAIAAEQQAASADPGERRYYLSQIAKFTNQSYKDAMKNAGIRGSGYRIGRKAVLSKRSSRIGHSWWQTILYRLVPHRIFCRFFVKILAKIQGNVNNRDLFHCLNILMNTVNK